MYNKHYVGIDLGTTNSAVTIATVANGRITATPHYVSRMVPASQMMFSESLTFTPCSDRLLPSAVFYDGNGRIIVGDFAKSQASKYVDRVALSIKSQMGQESISGLADDIVANEKTPERISQRILSQIKASVEEETKSEVENVIITVPANFNTAARQATLRAAELAGFNVKNADGSYKNVLISEPNAVLYKLCHLIQSKEMLDVLGLYSGDGRARTVLIFDIGGGTLDCTIQRISLDENGVTLNIEEIVTPRFTQVAGDTFDKVIAEALFERYIRILEKNAPASINRAMGARAQITRLLRMSAETLKMKIGVKEKFSFFGGDTVCNSVPLSQNVGMQIQYNDNVTKDEFEKMVAHLLGNGLCYDDYRGYSQNPKIDRNNIIAPVLEALEKAEQRLRSIGEELRIDHVILNGGMANQYLISSRIEQFFGMKPITLRQPDLSVAEGAGIYCALADSYEMPVYKQIVIKKHVQTEDLYLGLSAGSNTLLIKDGCALPYSNEIDGYRIRPGTQCISLPIKVGVDHGEPQTIATSVITFKRQYPDMTRLKLEYSINDSGLLDITAYLYSLGGSLLDRASVEFVIGAGGQTSRSRGHKSDADKILPPDNAVLVPANELSALKNLINCNPSQKNAKRSDPQSRSKEIGIRLNVIFNCANPEAFENFVLRELRTASNINLRRCLYMIAQRLFPFWSGNAVTSIREIASTDILGADSSFIDKDRALLSDFVKDVIACIEGKAKMATPSANNCA